ncbi:hypothetical protein B296_00020105 [Ensete ventricosum]|uniref:Uncharacterized protein n=1 Tax=Ensete ventricosum TaxID=4639 RepID=A0A426YVE6_ENSVE|nr:hypothetical protein B296_00020105 [Ensete ventricosum]
MHYPKFCSSRVLLAESDSAEEEIEVDASAWRRKGDGRWRRKFDSKGWRLALEGRCQHIQDRSGKRMCRSIFAVEGKVDELFLREIALIPYFIVDSSSSTVATSASAIDGTNEISTDLPASADTVVCTANDALLQPISSLLLLLLCPLLCFVGLTMLPVVIAARYFSIPEFYGKLVSYERQTNLIIEAFSLPVYSVGFEGSVR